MNKETWEEQKDRLRLMAAGLDPWDLSPRDCQAIAAALEMTKKSQQIIIKLLRVMDMQEKRETGEFHLSQEAMRRLWDEAIAEAVCLIEFNE